VSISTLVSRASPAATSHRRRAWPHWRRMQRLDWVTTALTAIILGGASARLLGGNWGLPLEFHPDEHVIVYGAIDMARRHSFEPPLYFRPDHVEMQLSNLAYLAYGYLFHGSSPGSLYASDPAPFIFISRTITACFGIAMIVVAYLIGKRFTRAIGVLAAFLVAFFPMYVDESHFATPDVPLSLTLMIVILGCMRYLDSPSWGNLLLASFGVSVSIAIKYPGALGSIMIAITVITGAVRTRAWSRILVHGAGALAAVVGFLFVISPVLFTNINVAWSSMTAEAGNTFPGADGLGWTGNMGFYAQTFATTVGIILLVCFALGVLWSVRLRLVQSLPLWLGAIYWVLLSAIPLHWPRWGLPMYLTPLLIAPIGAYYSFRYLLERRAAPWLRWGAVGLGAVMSANLMAGSVAATASYRAPDTRTVATQYFAVHGVDTTNTIYEGYTPLFPGEPKAIFNEFKYVNGRLVLSSTGHGSSRIRYVALSSYMYARYLGDPRYASKQRFYAMLKEQFPLLMTFYPATRRNATVLEGTNIWNALDYVGQVARGGLCGPNIELYEIPAKRT
jgi:4-amino-4-deoxy-L-arabinose transferase-like glycosyltransferase